eukprot:11179605-Lingulodinium_polyedra.AAC.1
MGVLPTRQPDDFVRCPNSPNPNPSLLADILRLWYTFAGRLHRAGSCTLGAPKTNQQLALVVAN